MSSSQQVIATEPREQSGVPTKKSWWRRLQTNAIKSYRGFKHLFDIHDVDLDQIHERHGSFPVYLCKKCAVSCTREDAIAQQMLFRAEFCLWLIICSLSIYFLDWWSILPIIVYTAQRTYRLNNRF